MTKKKRKTLQAGHVHADNNLAVAQGEAASSYTEAEDHIQEALGSIIPDTEFSIPE